MAMLDYSMRTDNPTLTPQRLVSDYERAYHFATGREPRVRHLGGQWYYVNGETVHRVALMAETIRLHNMAQDRNPFKVMPTKSLINRLISRLRTL
jgi:hypothetical protein